MSSGVLQVIQRLEQTGRASREDLARLMGSDESTAEHLYQAADRVRASVAGDEVHLRALIEFSNRCHRNCLYCGLRRDHRELPRYRMRPEQILRVARRAAALGYRTVVLQSGEDHWYTAPMLAEVVRDINTECEIAITLSIGERSEEEYRLLKAAGADRFLLRIETSSPTLYRELHPGSDRRRRVECLHALRRAGFQLGSGVLIGLPGQTVEMLADDLLFLQGLELDMIGVGPFIPHPATPLAEAAGGTLDLSLRFLSCMRLLCPEALIPATTALGALDPKGWERGLRAGADVVMPNVTPFQYRERYQLYPGKIWNRDQAAEFRKRVEAALAGMGRRVSSAYGHSRRREKAAACA